MSKQLPPAPTANTIGPCPTRFQVGRSPRHWKFTQPLRTTRPPLSLLEVSDLETGPYQLSFRFLTMVRTSSYFPMAPWILLQASPGRVAQSVEHLTCKSGVLGSIPGLATYFRFSFRFFKKGSCQLLAKVCARSTG